MGKLLWDAAALLSPVPVVMVTVREGVRDNIITVAWVGTVCTKPPMLSISVRPERYSYEMIKKSGVFAVNIPNRKLMMETDFCGVKSGRNIDKFQELNLIKEEARKINCPILKQSPMSLECVVKKTIALGTHDMFIAEIVAVDVEESLIDKAGRLCLDKANLLCYNHGQYCVGLSHEGKFGFSVEKKRKPGKKK